MIQSRKFLYVQKLPYETPPGFTISLYETEVLTSMIIFGLYPPPYGKGGDIPLSLKEISDLYFKKWKRFYKSGKSKYRRHQMKFVAKILIKFIKMDLVKLIDTKGN